MAGWLNYGAGAHAGIEEQLDNEFKRQAQERLDAAQAENIRHNQAQEDYQRENMKALAEDRLLNRQSLDAYRKSQTDNMNRDDIRQEVAMMGKGTQVDPKDYQRYTTEGHIPKNVFDANMFEGPLPEGESPGGRDSIIFQGLPKKAGTTSLQQKTMMLPTGPGGKLQPEDVGWDPTDDTYQFKGKDVTAQVSHYEKPPAPDRVWMQYMDANGNMVLGPRAKMGETAAAQGGGGATGGGTTGDGADTGGGRGIPPGTVRAPLDAAGRKELRNINELLPQIQEALDLGKETGWKGIGPIASMEGKVHEVTGWDLLDEGQQGIDLRQLLNEMKATASFAKGGANLTSTEVAQMKLFLATVDQDPQTAVARLQRFIITNEQKKKALLGQDPGSVDTTRPGQTPKAAPPTADGNEIVHDAKGNVISSPR